MSKIKRKCYYDRRSNPVKYQKDDLILIRNESGKKIDKLFDGPYQVISEKEPNVIVLKNGKNETVHKNRTKPYVH